VILQNQYNEYRIAGNFHRTLFSEILEASGIFQKFVTKWCFKVFQACSKEGKDNQKFQKYFFKIFIEKNFLKI